MAGGMVLFVAVSKPPEHARWRRHSWSRSGFSARRGTPRPEDSRPARRMNNGAPAAGQAPSIQARLASKRTYWRGRSGVDRRLVRKLACIELHPRGQAGAGRSYG